MSAEACLLVCLGTWRRLQIKVKDPQIFQPQTFSFDRVFMPEATQQSVYEVVGRYGPHTHTQPASRVLDACQTMARVRSRVESDFCGFMRRCPALVCMCV